MNMGVHPARRPDLPTSLFKYTSLESTRAILRNQTLQWSTPDALNRFNDAFDVCTEVLSAVSGPELGMAVNRRMLQIIRGEAPAPNPCFDLLPIVLKLCENPIRKAELISKMEMPWTHPTPHTDHMEKMWQQSRSAMRILCLAERNDNNALWVHYADKNAGVVLEFGTESDSAFRLAAPIQYDNKPPLANPEFWADILIGGSAQNGARDIFRNAIYHKQKCWAYEEEWRLFTYQSGGGDFSYWGFPPSDLYALYLGHRMQPRDEADILGIRDSLYPRTKVFKADKGSSRLNFTQIR